MEPDCDWSWLRSVHAYLRSRARRQPVKKGNVVHAADLFSLGMELIHGSVSDDGTAVIHLSPYPNFPGRSIRSLVRRPDRDIEFSDITVHTSIHHYL